MYHRRSNFNPLWNTLIVGGLQDGEPYLGYIDKLGTAYKNDTVASGFGAYLASVSTQKCYCKAHIDTYFVKFTLFVCCPEYSLHVVLAAVAP
jgi:20S proteasome alpha/beta subunit